MRRPSVDMSVFSERRGRLASLIKGSALILPAHPEFIRNNDVPYPYRQDSNLFYLTGFEEPGSVFVFRPGLEPEAVLFVRKKNPFHETWDGFRYGVDGAKSAFAMDETYPIEEFAQQAPELLKDVDIIYYSLFHNMDFDNQLRDVIGEVKRRWGRSGRGNLAIKDSYPLLGEMRIHKNEQEVEWMRKACQISAEAHIEVMRATKPGVNERALEGVFLKSIMERGSERIGYNPIVATGNNATTLHYVFNDQPLEDQDLLLIDAGAEFRYYTGDITRTYPVTGKFNETQRRVYERVLETQKKLVSMVKPGASIKLLQDEAVSGLVDIMLDEKLLKGKKETLIENKDYRKYYPHNIGHWLGMDVHDSGTYQVHNEPRVFEPGMCITVEPGLYVPADDADAPKELRGLGIRIEDNILVTADGHENLTFSAPKEITDLEAIIGKN